MEGPTSKKINEPPKKANHKGNIKFLNPLQSGDIKQGKLKGGHPQRMPCLDEPSPTEQRLYLNKWVPVTFGHCEVPRFL